MTSRWAAIVKGPDRPWFREIKYPLSYSASQRRWSVSRNKAVAGRDAGYGGGGQWRRLRDTKQLKSNKTDHSIAIND